MPNAAVRFQECINGRDYRIEVARVGTSRWRAHLVTAHGAPRALMPFYGPTPEQAAGLLSAWLAKAHRKAPPA
jgi:hypothetical protein